MGECFRCRPDWHQTPGVEGSGVKYDQRGHKLWETLLPGLDVHSQDEIHALVVDGNGDVFVAGRVSKRFAVFKLHGPSGEVAWPTSVSDFPAGTAKALVLTPYGSVVVVGAINGSFATAEFNATTGAEVVDRLLLPGEGEARAIALDPAGIPIAVGSVRASGLGNSFMAAAKFSAGAIVWSQYLTGPSGPGINTASAAVVSASGLVVIGGSLTNTGTNADASLVALNLDGGEQWRQSLDGTAHLSDVINALALMDAFDVSPNQPLGQEYGPTGGTLYQDRITQK
jgi:putative pyrroloquinoline-quinone binding quinoprotein